MLVDTHAHIHFDDYASEIDSVLANAKAAGVDSIISVGVDEADSSKAIALAEAHDNVWATAGLHPHDASHGQAALDIVAKLAQHPKVVGIGECGLDYFRNLSNKTEQEHALRFHIELGLKLNKPMVFHVRDAFEEFFEIIDEYEGVKGLVHCFTSTKQHAEAAIERGLLIALNGIMTFTKDEAQLEAAKWIPLDRLVLETDCPFLTPHPHRGKRNEPANIKLIAEFLAKLRHEELAVFSAQTTKNAISLFNLE